ncbi:MAG: DUF2007 domain-containing protein [Thermodesulfovibrionales bacterium]
MKIAPRFNTEFVELLSLFDPVKVIIIKSLLEDEGIEYYLKGEYSSLIEPAIEPVRLMVRRDQVEVAKEILGIES